MSKRILGTRVTLLISLLVTLLLTLITASVAWFTGLVTARGNGEFSAESIVAYFAGGDGSEGNPYRIELPIHLYNLSWLQNLNAFEDKTYFKVADKDGNPVTIDMAGELCGIENGSGAIPPIGTKANPFMGYFDGNGSVISNLWVSTNPEDWREHPENPPSYSSSHVGLFGAIGSEPDATDGAVVKNLIIDRMELTNHLPNTTVGIICGYVDAKVADVGVYNGIVDLQAIGVTSSYTLFGELAIDVNWADMPEISSKYGGMGGDLIIDPNDYVNDGAKAFQSVSSGTTEQVPYSIPGVAYFTGPLTADTAHYAGGHKNIYDMTKSTMKKGVSFTSDGSREQDKIEYMFSKYVSGDTVIKVSTSPFNSNGTVKSGSYISLDPDNNSSTNNSINVPKGGIWFKPTGPGRCAMAFAATDQSSDRYMMLYVCERDTDGNLVAVDMIEYILPVKSSNYFKNGNVAYYEYIVTEEQVDAKYEFFIGARPGDSNPDAGFFALMLAGADTEGDGNLKDETTYKKVVIDVDYVVEDILKGGGSIGDETYQNHATLLSIREATTTTGKLYYLAVGGINSSRVKYFPDGITVTDISVEGQADEVTKGGAPFLERDDGS